MNSLFLKKVLTVPVCMALVLGIALFAYLKLNIDSFIPLFNNTQYAYHDSAIDKEEENVQEMEFETDKNADPSTFEKNQCIGVIRAGEGYAIRYDMDYSRIQDSVSYLPQSVPFGETGFTYLYAGNFNAKDIAKDKSLTISSVFGEKRYVFKNRKSFTAEFDTLNYAPDCESAVIIYYRDSKNAGFTSKYIALVYEEVK